MTDDPSSVPSNERLRLGAFEFHLEDDGRLWISNEVSGGHISAKDREKLRVALSGDCSAPETKAQPPLNFRSITTSVGGPNDPTVTMRFASVGDAQAVHHWLAALQCADSFEETKAPAQPVPRCTGPHDLQRNPDDSADPTRYCTVCGIAEYQLKAKAPLIEPGTDLACEGFVQLVPHE